MGAGFDRGELRVDDELRAAERAFQQRGDEPAHEAYAALLRRLGRIDDVIDLLHPTLSPGLRGHAKLLAREQAQTDHFATVDPTYDGINLVCDASWAASLGKSLAAALAVPCTIAEGLR